MSILDGAYWGKEMKKKTRSDKIRNMDDELRMATLAAMEKYVPGTAAIMDMIGENHYV